MELVRTETLWAAVKMLKWALEWVEVEHSA